MYSDTHSLRETARVFHVSLSTVRELRGLFAATGPLERRLQLSPAAYPSNSP